MVPTEDKERLTVTTIRIRDTGHSAAVDVEAVEFQGVDTGEVDFQDVEEVPTNPGAGGNTDLPHLEEN